MPTIEENLNQWSDYDWSAGGDEWSEVWGGTENLWFGSVLPRVEQLLPVGHLVEIAPGFGRITQYLKDRCEAMTLVDLTSRCIDACRERFAEADHLRYIVNDGRSLPGVDDGSADLVFSFDSLVHVEIEVMEGYIAELARVLKPEGSAFLHHSNMAAFLRPDGDGFTIENNHWRGKTVSAEKVRSLCADVGLVVYRQEIVNWGCNHLTDSLTYIARRGSARDVEPEIFNNPGFMDEAIRLGERGWEAEAR